MYLKQLLWFIILHLVVSFGQEIGVVFNTTIVLDNSTINWNYFNIFQCGISSTEIDETSWYPQTTIMSITTITTQNPFDTSTIDVFTIVQSTSLYTCADGSYGIYCNISSAVCDVTNPCLNEGICYSNNTLSSGYFCQCPSGFSGYDCEYDNRICTGYTCWNNGTCTEINTTISGDIETSYSCQCVYGYDGTNCELVSDLCGNITCEYDGVCISSYLMWSCQCLDSSLYSGIYCQDKSSALITKQILCRSFAIAAIIALCCVFAFVFTMDILKYVFKIDPVDRERHRLRMEQEKKEQKKFRKKIKKKTQIIITRFSTV